jgi:hypothetical protein
MRTNDLKDKILKLIDEVQDDTVLATFYNLLSAIQHSKEGTLWARLTVQEQEDLLRIEKDCYDSADLISHEEMLKKHRKWL